MAEYREVTLPQDQLSRCLVCGGAVFDQSQHTQWHREQGDPEDLSHLGGANEVPPLPERD